MYRVREMPLLLKKPITWQCMEKPLQLIINALRIIFWDKGAMVWDISLHPVVISNIPPINPESSSGFIPNGKRNGIRIWDMVFMKLIFSKMFMITEKRIINPPI